MMTMDGSCIAQIFPSRKLNAVEYEGSALNILQKQE